MCGITGFLDLSRQCDVSYLQTTVQRMASTLRHRGPDDHGEWADAAAGVALGHRRLSIIDLSPEGHQPMLSASGRYVVVFNGEIYNFQAVRKELDDEAGGTGIRWRGHSDTEVMLGAIDRWSLEPAVKRFAGMFAFALWDRKERLLHLVRDRLGKKPLYYGWMGDVFLFASELKALRAHPAFKAEIDRNSLALYLRFKYVPAPYSIYKGIRKLPPATTLTVDPFSAQDSALSTAPVPYWSALEAAQRGLADPYRSSTEDAVAELDLLLREAVRERMISDVPLGAFLSGGIDSSLIVALMQAQNERPVKTFTIGFHESRYNEAEDARAVACHLGTEHTELYLTPAETMAVIPHLPDLFDEPFSDPSQIPTFLVSEMARRHVTVALSGDGGDELFGGYTRYFAGLELWGKVGWMPSFSRLAISGLLSSVPAGPMNAAFGWLRPLFEKYGYSGKPGDKFHKMANTLGFARPEALYLRMVSDWKDPASVVLGSAEPPTIFVDHSVAASLHEFAHKMMYLDTVTYLPDDILVKVDRASMGASLEARAPLLDHRVVQHVWRLPLSMRIRRDEGKWILRRVLDKYVPREMYDRPKKGFSVPIGSWLRGPLKDWAGSLLDEHRLCEEGLLDPRPIMEKWGEHLSGARDWEFYLWDILMFESWLEKWGSPDPGP